MRFIKNWFRKQYNTIQYNATYNTVDRKLICHILQHTVVRNEISIYISKGNKTEILSHAVIFLSNRNGKHLSECQLDFKTHISSPATTKVWAAMTARLAEASLTESLPLTQTCFTHFLSRWEEEERGDDCCLELLDVEVEVEASIADILAILSKVTAVLIRVSV